MAAFRLAVGLGADGVELDTQLSADGVPVVIHDARVNRTTNGRGVVSGLTLDHLRNLDAGTWFERRLSRRPRVRTAARRFSSSFTDQSVPTLEEVLALLDPAGLRRIYVELKGNPENKHELLDAILLLVGRGSLRDTVTLLSFDHAIVRRAKEIGGDVRTAATFPARGRRLISISSLIRSAEHARVDEVAVHYGLATRRTVNALHERGFSVSVWTVNSKLAMRRLVACGVDSIMTNFPNRLSEVLKTEARGPGALRGRESSFR